MNTFTNGDFLIVVNEEIVDGTVQADEEQEEMSDEEEEDDVDVDTVLTEEEIRREVEALQEAVPALAVGGTTETFVEDFVIASSGAITDYGMKQVCSKVRTMHDHMEKEIKELEEEMDTKCKVFLSEEREKVQKEYERITEAIKAKNENELQRCRSSIAEMENEKSEMRSEIDEMKEQFKQLKQVEENEIAELKALVEMAKSSVSNRAEEMLHMKEKEKELEQLIKKETEEFELAKEQFEKREWLWKKKFETLRKEVDGLLPKNQAQDLCRRAEQVAETHLKRKMEAELLGLEMSDEDDDEDRLESDPTSTYEDFLLGPSPMELHRLSQQRGRGGRGKRGRRGGRGG